MNIMVYIVSLVPRRSRGHLVQLTGAIPIDDFIMWVDDACVRARTLGPKHWGGGGGGGGRTSWGETQPNPWYPHPRFRILFSVCEAERYMVAETLAIASWQPYKHIVFVVIDERCSRNTRHFQLEKGIPEGPGIFEHAIIIEAIKCNRCQLGFERVLELAIDCVRRIGSIADHVTSLEYQISGKLSAYTNSVYQVLPPLPRAPVNEASGSWAYKFS